MNKVVIEPGAANEKLANWLSNNANRFSGIYTQRAISDAWVKNKTLAFSKLNPTEVDYGVLKGTNLRVYQMHKHNPQIPVNTVQALQCALKRLNDKQEEIILVTHHTHFQRAYRNFSAIYDKALIINPFIKDVPYPESHGPI